MAVFNPDNTAPEPTNFTGRSQGIPVNRAGEVLLEGLGATLQSAAMTKDFGIQKEIEADVNTLDDIFRKKVGYTEEEAFAMEQGKGAPIKDIPPEFQGQSAEFEEQISDLLEAKRQGRLSDTYYYSQLAYSMKAVKAKYPGYSDIVDSIYQKVTGVQPANAMRSALAAEYDALTKSKDQAKKEMEDRLWQMKDYIAIDHPEFFENREAFAGREDEILNGAVKRAAKDQLNDSKKKEMDRLAEEGKLASGEAESMFTQTAENIVQTAIDAQLAKAVGPNGENWNQMLSLFINGKPNPQQLAWLENEIMKMDSEVTYSLQKELMSPYARAISSEKRKTIIDNARARMDFLKQSLKDENFGVALMFERSNKQIKDRAENWALENSPGYLELQVLNEASPLAAQDFYGKYKNDPSFLGGLVPGQLVNIFSGKSTLSQSIDAIDANPSLSPEEKSEAATRVFQDAKEFFMSPNMSETTLREFVSKNFGGKDSDLDKLWPKLDAESKTEFYRYWTDPAIVDRLVQLKDPMIAQQYAVWLKDSINEVPDFKRAIDALSGRQETPAGTMYRYEFDPATMGIKVVPSDESLKAAKEFDPSALPSAPGSPPVSNNVFLERQIARQQKMLEPLNNALRGAVDAMNKLEPLTGVNGSQALQEIFQDAGANIVLPPTTGGGPQGASPFEEQGSLTGRGSTSSDYRPVSFNWSDNDIQTAMASGNYGSLLNFVGELEAPLGYNQAYGSKKFLPREGMTLNEVLEWQDKQVQGGSPSSAVGRYQFLRKTLRSLKGELDLTGDEIFDNALQDRLAEELVNRRGGRDYLAGRLSREEFLDNLAKEWASLPTRWGESYYSGDGLNKALTTTDEALAAIDSLGG